MKEHETKHFRVDENDMLWFKDRLVVPKDRELRNQILSKAHSSKLSIHPGSSKMYHDLKPVKGNIMELILFKKLKNKSILHTIQTHMAAAQARQKSYADRRRKPIEFKVGDFVYLKVSPMKSVQHFGVKRKLAPRYVGPFEIIGQSGKVAYKIQLPPEMSAIFNVFHVSQLKKCLCIPEEREFHWGISS